MRTGRLLGMIFAVRLVCVDGRLWAEIPATISSESATLMLDLSPYYWDKFATQSRTNVRFNGIMGRREFDGVPFQVDGRVCLYGSAQVEETNLTRTNYPDIIGIKVGRKFDELHLLHATKWSDVEGEIIAYIRLNYTDGSLHEFPIGYGVHVRDWQRLQSEQREQLTDTASKVIWRGPGVPHFKSSQRMFKSAMTNPFPERLVNSIDFVSTSKIASYDVSAATVAAHDPNRPVTPPVPLERPERKFNGELVVQVVDTTGHPVQGVRVYPSISVPESCWVTAAAPFYTTAEGMGKVRFPTDESRCLAFDVKKAGWIPTSQVVRLGTNGASQSGIVVTIQIKPDSQVAHPAGAVASGITGTTGVSATTNPAVGSAGGASASASGEMAQVLGVFRPLPILFIAEPVGSTVRVEYSDSLSPPTWQPLKVLTNLPHSPYPFVCGQEAPPQPQRFYRAVRIE